MFGKLQMRLTTRGPRRYRNLTVGLLGVLLLPAFLREWFPGAGMLGPALFVVLVSRSVVTFRGTRLARAVLTTAMIAVALRGSRVVSLFPMHLRSVGMALHLLTVLGFAFVVYEVLRHVLSEGQVDADKLYAAVSAYLLMGLTFASVYEALAFWTADAFSFANPHDQDADALMYFSLVTLSTVGYGDVVPAIPQTRVLSVLEAISGQLYLAVLMARLVGLHLTQPHASAALPSTALDSPTSNAEPPP